MGEGESSGGKGGRRENGGKSAMVVGGIDAPALQLYMYGLLDVSVLCECTQWLHFNRHVVCVMFQVEHQLSTGR